MHPNPASPDDFPLADFDQLQADLHYRRAQTFLDQMLQNLDLSNRERSGMEAAVKSLYRLSDKLAQGVVQIAVFGLVGRGKSSLLNALVGEAVFATGPTHGVTQRIESCPWQVDRLEQTVQEDPVQEDLGQQVVLPGGGASRIELIDTPGLDEIGGKKRELLAQRVARRADLILFVVSGDMTQGEYAALSNLRRASKPMVLVFNKVDQYPDADRQAIYSKIRDDRVRGLLSPDEIVMVAAAPIVTTATRRAHGQVEIQRRPGPPQIEALKLKILDLLYQEGKSLIALNTMLYADAIQDQIVERKMAIRERRAEQVIWNGALTKAIAVALNPLTVVDVVSAAAVDVVMIVTLSRLYGLPMTEKGAVTLLRSMALSMGGITASELLVSLGLGSLKTLLGAVIPLTGGTSLAPYLPVAITQGAVAGVSSYGIGQVTKQYLLQGATWGPTGAKVVVQEILASLDEASILARLRSELRAQLTNSG
jgi:small GTP-binding protein